MVSFFNLNVFFLVACFVLFFLRVLVGHRSKTCSTGVFLAYERLNALGAILFSSRERDERGVKVLFALPFPLINSA